MKKVIAINGSPRKKGNTVTLLQHALNGAEASGAQTEIVHLYDLNFKGCTSCFACKLKGSKFIGKCAMKDELTPVLEKVMQNDTIILGSPIYVNNITGEMQSFLERLIFMNLSYDDPSYSNFNGRINTGFIYSMNRSVESMHEVGYEYFFEIHKSIGDLFKGKWEYMTSNDTHQFNNYSKYAVSLFDEAHKNKVRNEQFPVDCRNAFEMGKRLTEYQ